MTIKLVYKGKQEWPGQEPMRLWDLIEPKLPGYDYKYGYPTFGTAGLKEHGVI